MDKEKKYFNFLRKLEDCMGCEMRNFGSPVFSGNHMQEMMIIGYEPESHNVHISSELITKTSSLLTLYEKEIKYGAYITYLYRCSLQVHGKMRDEGKKNCKKFLKEELLIIQPKYVIIYDERVIEGICDEPKEITEAKEYPCKSKIFGFETLIYFIK